MAKLAFFFHLFCGLATLGVCVGLWFAADRLGTRTQIESFLGDLLGTKNFELFGDKLLRAAAGLTGGLILLATTGTVLMAFVYNMLSGIFGGVVVSVLQERLTAPAAETAVGAETAPTDVSERPPAPRKLSRRQQRRRRRNRKRAKQGLAASTAAVAADPMSQPTTGSGQFGQDPADFGHTGYDRGPSIGEAPLQAAVADGSATSVDDWLAESTDPTGSWMSPGTR